jgi:hypothetical protein
MKDNDAHLLQEAYNKLNEDGNYIPDGQIGSQAQIGVEELGDEITDLEDSESFRKYAPEQIEVVEDRLSSLSKYIYKKLKDGEDPIKLLEFVRDEANEVYSRWVQDYDNEI